MIVLDTNAAICVVRSFHELAEDSRQRLSNVGPFLDSAHERGEMVAIPKVVKEEILAIGSLERRAAWEAAWSTLDGPLLVLDDELQPVQRALARMQQVLQHHPLGQDRDWARHHKDLRVLATAFGWQCTVIISYDEDLYVIADLLRGGGISIEVRGFGEPNSLFDDRPLPWRQSAL